MNPADIPDEGLARLVTAVVLLDVKQYQQSNVTGRAQWLRHFQSDRYAQLLAVIGRAPESFCASVEKI